MPGMTPTHSLSQSPARRTAPDDDWLETRLRYPILTLWGTWLFSVILLGLFSGGLSPSASSTSGEVAVILHALLASVIFVVSFERKLATILIASLAIRVLLVFWDLYFRGVFKLLQSGADSEMFYGFTVAVSRDPSLLTEDLRGGVFSKTFGVLLNIIGPSRAFAQYTNALLGVTLVLLFCHILRELRLAEQLSLRLVGVAAFLPHGLILSAIFLRESIIATLVAASLLFFVRWFKSGGFLNFLLAVGAILLASAFHSGVVVLILGYGIVAAFYRRRTNSYGVSFTSLPYVALLAIVGVAVTINYPDLFLGKFQDFETAEDLFEATNSRWGGSAYLPGLTIDSYGDLALYGPLRAFYFMAAPVPWDFRGLFDVVAFVLDSSFYIFAVFQFFRNFRRLGSHRPLAIAVFIVLMISLFVFGAGVSNSGTAMRHRYKLFAVFLVLAAVTGDRSRAACDPLAPSITAPISDSDRSDARGLRRDHQRIPK